jgi:hypothetical protein
MMHVQWNLGKGNLLVALCSGYSISIFDIQRWNKTTKAHSFLSQLEIHLESCSKFSDLEIGDTVLTEGSTDETSVPSHAVSRAVPPGLKMETDWRGGGVSIKLMLNLSAERGVSVIPTMTLRDFHVLTGSQTTHQQCHGLARPQRPAKAPCKSVRRLSGTAARAGSFLVWLRVKRRQTLTIGLASLSPEIVAGWRRGGRKEGGFRELRYFDMEA